MVNRTIAIIDLDSSFNQHIETLLFACILEKKVKKVSVIDLNPFDGSDILPKRQFWKEQDDILTIELFDNTLYQIANKINPTQIKLANFVTYRQRYSDILLISGNNQQDNLNLPFFQKATDFVLFVDIKNNSAKNLIKFFVKHKAKDANVSILVYNYEDNVQLNKEYIQILKQFKNDKVSVDKIGSFPKLDNLKQIENIDPWQPIYKKINSTF